MSLRRGGRMRVHAKTIPGRSIANPKRTLPGSLRSRAIKAVGPRSNICNCGAAAGGVTGQFRNGERWKMTRDTCSRQFDCGEVTPRARAPSDSGGEIPLRPGDLLCRLDRIFVQRDLHRPIPIAGAKAHLKLVCVSRRDSVTRAMAVDQMLQLREELRQIRIGIHGSFSS